MLNANKLKGRLAENGVSVTQISKLLNISPSTFYRKLKNNSFEISEADAIVEFLELSTNDAKEIFFAQLSHKCDKPKEGV